MNYMYLTSAEANSKANELLKANPNYRKVNTAIDSRCSIENSDAFSQIIGDWSGETSAIAIEDENGQIIDRFAFWENGSKELIASIDGHKISVYITEDLYYINCHNDRGWGRYEIENFTIVDALVAQYFAENDDEWDDEHERVYEIAKRIGGLFYREIND